MKPLALLTVLALGLLLDGCGSGAPPAHRDSPPIHTRCLNDRGEGSTRPIIFLFCAESP
jgi:hypothetical protein